MQSSEKKAYENLPLSSVKSPIRKVITKETKKCSPSRESNVVNVYVIDIKLGVAWIVTEKANKTWYYKDEV